MVNFVRHAMMTQGILTQKGLSALLVMGASNILYLVGTDAPSAAVVYEDGRVKTLSSRLEYVRTLDEAQLGEHYTFSREGDLAEYENAIRGDFYAAVKELLADVPRGKLGHAGVSQGARRKLEEMGIDGIDVSSDFIELRRRKEPSEVEALRSSARLAEEALARAVSTLEAGVTEAEVTAEIVSFMLRNGFQPSFPPIVAFSENAAHPHARPSLRRLRVGDVVKIDLGARVEGYCSDLTRTFIYGEASELPKRIYYAVLKAQEASIEALRVGVPAREAHLRALRMLKNEGLSKYFNHGLGHGVGVDIHEEPYLNAESDVVLSPGNVVTVEPGVYIRGTCGVRIEDMVLVTEGGPEVLTSFPKFLEL